MNKEAAREPYYRLQWKPDAAFLDTDGAHSLQITADFLAPSGAAYLDEVYNIRTRLETVTVLYICSASGEMEGKDELPTERSLKWIRDTTTGCAT